MKSVKLNEDRTTRYVCEDEQIEEFKQLVGQKFMCVHDLTRPNEYGDKKPRSTWIESGEIFNVNAILFSITKEETFDEYVWNVEKPTEDEKVLIELGLLEPVFVEFYTLKIDPPTKSHNNILPQFESIGEFWQHFRVYQERAMMTESAESDTLLDLGIITPFQKLVMDYKFKPTKHDPDTFEKDLGTTILNLYEDDDTFCTVVKLRRREDGDIEHLKTYSYLPHYEAEDLIRKLMALINESAETDTMFELGIIDEFEKIVMDYKFKKIDELTYEREVNGHLILLERSEEVSDRWMVTRFEMLQGSYSPIGDEVFTDLTELAKYVHKILESVTNSWTIDESINEPVRYLCEVSGENRLLPVSLNPDFFFSVLNKRFKCTKALSLASTKRRSCYQLNVGNTVMMTDLSIWVKSDKSDAFKRVERIWKATAEEIVMGELEIIPSIPVMNAIIRLNGMTKNEPHWNWTFPYKQKFLDHFTEVPTKVNESYESDILYDLGIIEDFDKLMIMYGFEKDHLGDFRKYLPNDQVLIINTNNGYETAIYYMSLIDSEGNYRLIHMEDNYFENVDDLSDYLAQNFKKVNESYEDDEVLNGLGIISDFELLMSKYGFANDESNPHDSLYVKNFGENSQLVVTPYEDDHYEVNIYRRIIKSPLGDVALDPIEDNYLAGLRSLKYYLSQKLDNINEKSDEDDLLIDLGILDPFEQLMNELEFTKINDLKYFKNTERGKRYIYNLGDGKYQTIAYGWYDDGDGSSYEDEDDNEKFDSLEDVRKYFTDQPDPLLELRQYLTDTLGRIVIR